VFKPLNSEPETERLDMFKLKNVLITIVVTLLMLTACEKKEPVVDYKAEAHEFCEVFNPDKWKDLPADVQPAQIQQMLADRLSAAVSSPKMKEIVKTIPTMPANLRYKYVVESVGALTGEPFSCPGMKDYFNP